MRFVILCHALPVSHSRSGVHWDLMLEHGGALLTWALIHRPAPSTHQMAQRLADHRLEYLDYEGPVSGERGHVTRWDQGTYEGLEDADFPGSDKARLWAVMLSGLRFTAPLKLQHIENDQWSIEIGANAETSSA